MDVPGVPLVKASPRLSPLIPLRSFKAFAADIKLAHSVFALPFAASAFNVGRLPAPTLAQAGLLLLCMVGGRSFAMGMNRYLDRIVDTANPRTRVRMIPSGKLTAAQSLGWSLASAAVLIAGAFALNPLAGYCAVPLLVLLMLYSMMKHWSWGTHWYLGFCLGLAPVAVAVAVAGAVPWPVLVLGVAVTLWTAGFDILYAMQDMEFDKRVGLKSVPSRFGPAASLWISRLCFAGMVTLLLVAGLAAGRGTLFVAGVAVVAAILGYEHWLVRDAKETGRSKNLNAAFFNANAAVSIVFFVFAEADRWLLG